MAIPDLQQCPLKLLTKYEIDVFLTCVCSLAVSIQKGLAHFWIIKSDGETELNTYGQKKDGFFHIFDQIKDHRYRCEWALPSLHGGSLIY